jgi:hypothetical protein
VITEDQALEAVAVLDEVFTELSEQGAWR